MQRSSNQELEIKSAEELHSGDEECFSEDFTILTNEEKMSLTSTSVKLLTISVVSPIFLLSMINDRLESLD